MKEEKIKLYKDEWKDNNLIIKLPPQIDFKMYSFAFTRFIYKYNFSIDKKDYPIPFIDTILNLNNKIYNIDEYIINSGYLQYGKDMSDKDIRIWVNLQLLNKEE